MRNRTLGALSAAFVLIALLPIRVEAGSVAKPAAAVRPSAPRHTTYLMSRAQGLTPRARTSRTPTGRSAPAASAPTTAPQSSPPRSFSSQLVQDPGFNNAPSFPAWQQGATTNPPRIDSNRPHSPRYSADLCQNAPNCADFVDQPITRPGYVFSATLSYWFVLQAPFNPNNPPPCADVLQVAVVLQGGSQGAGAEYCEDWAAAGVYTHDTVDATSFLRNMQTDNAFVVAQAFSDSNGQSRFWVDDITLDITWGIPPGVPTDVVAQPHNGSVTLNWKPPATGSEPITSYSILQFTDGVYNGSPMITPSGSSTQSIHQLNGAPLTNGLPVSFKVAAISSAGQGPYSAMSNTVTPAVSLSYEAVTGDQYTLANSDGSTWQTLGASSMYFSNTELRVTPAVDSVGVITANADLWTATAGVNQDLGVAIQTMPASPGSPPGTRYPTIAGQPEVWKESGGSNGTFSPNAAALQAVLPLAAGTSYQLNLVWKANRAAPGSTIYAGAGPIAGSFSPTRLTVQLFSASAATAMQSVSTRQFGMQAANDGTQWADLGAGAPALHFTAPGNGLMLLTGNADLWSSVAGFNQDLAIAVNGSVGAWKESGSYGGTFSPNAAMVEDVVNVTSGNYDVKLQWKPNRASSQPPIYAGAGPINGAYSPTLLTLVFIPDAQGGTSEVHTTTQYTLSNNNGNAWMDIDSSHLSMTITPPLDCVATLTGNADLWTANAGFNQDLGIKVSSPSGSYGPERVGWKESGGAIGTYSPNAAFVQTAFAMRAGVPYTITLQWKANRADPGIIVAGAGNGPTYSPTRLTSELLCPHPPVVTGISPSSGPTTGGTTITITGSHFNQGPEVTFGAFVNFSRVPSTASDTQLTVTTMAHPEGPVDVRVLTGDGYSAPVAADIFRFSYAAVVLADSPSIYYRFGEASGALASDSSGNGHNAAYSASGVTLASQGAIAGNVDTAITLDGQQGFVEESSGAGLPLGNGSRSIECWFETTNYGGTIAAWGPSGGAQGEYFRLIFGSDDFALGIGGGAAYGMQPANYTPGALANGLWHHFVLTYDASSGTLATYVDGNPFSSSTISALNTKAGPLDIGGLDPATASTAGFNGFKGSIDEMAFYPAALTPAQVLNHYKAGRALPGAWG